MRVLVTGAAGFIGRHLRAELAAAGHEVVGVDRAQHGCGRIDLAAPGACERLLESIEAAGVDTVVHLAAKVGRAFGEDDLTATVLENAAVTARLASACANTGVRLAYASSSEAYGDCGDAIAVEDLARAGELPWTRMYDQAPHNLYGLSKRWGEEACTLYAPDGLVIFRFSMPYGPGHPPGRGRAALTNILWQALTHEPIPIHLGSERSWCWIGDTVRAVRLILESGRAGAWNVGRDDNALPLRTVAEMACELVDAPSSLIEDVPAPARQTVVKRLSTAKLRSLGWRPEVELEEGMRRTLSWLRSLPATS